MEVEIVTKEDLQAFRVQLVNEIRQILQATQPKAEKQWLKNSDVKKLLNISSNTIQRLRISGKLKSSKIGGVHYYRYEDIELLLESGFEKEGLCRLIN
jgi:Helix-turn-helix domain